MSIEPEALLRAGWKPRARARSRPRRCRGSAGRWRAKAPEGLLPGLGLEELPERRGLAPRNDQARRRRARSRGRLRLEARRRRSPRGPCGAPRSRPAARGRRRPRRPPAAPSITIRASAAGPLREGSPPRCPSCPSRAIPRPRAAPAASRQCVVALTIARARFSGSSDLKIPDPTKTASAPELHAERRVRGRRDAAGGEVRHGKLARLGDFDDELEGRLEALGRGHQLVLGELREHLASPGGPRAGA